MDKYTVDFTNVEYYLEMHEVIKKSLDFPDYYGRNWDAFWDCLTDMIGDPMVIEIIGLDVIERKFGDTAQKMVQIFKEAKHYYDNKYSDITHIVLVSGEHRVELQ